MFFDKINLLNYKRKFLFFNEHFLSKMMCVVIILNIFAFEALSQENERKNDLQRVSLESALSEFYPAQNPIYLFYIRREFEPFWIGNQKKLDSLTTNIGEAELHGLPSSRYPLDELKQAIFESKVCITLNSSHKKGHHYCREHLAFRNRIIYRLLLAVGQRTSRECCSGHRSDVLAKRAAEVAADLIFHSLPWVPQKGKWTKSGPRVDWFIKSMIPIPFLKLIWPIASGKIQPREVDFGQDVEAIMETSWHQVASKRVQQGNVFLSDEHAQEAIVLLGILMELLRWLTGWLLYFAYARRRKSFPIPPLCTFMSP